VAATVAVMEVGVAAAAAVAAQVLGRPFATSTLVGFPFSCMRYVRRILTSALCKSLSLLLIGSWTGVATVYDTFGLRIGKPLDYTLNLCTSAEAAATSEKASSDAKQAPSSSSENVLETWVWSSATTGSSSAEGNERKSPEQTSTWEVSPSACSMDVDPIDGSYSLDRGKGDGSDGAGPLLAHILNPKDLAQALGSEMGGEGSSSSSALGGELGIGRCIEHAIAMDDRTRMRCVCVFARGDGRPLAVVQLNETRVGEYTGPAADASVLSGMSTSSILAGSSSAGPGNGGGDIEELEVAFPIVSLDVLAQAPWVGEMTLRNYKSDKSKVGSGLKFNSGTKSVAKLELLYNWANVNFLPKKTTIRAGFGAQANEEESFWTDGRLNEHPLWGKSYFFQPFGTGVGAILTVHSRINLK